MTEFIMDFKSFLTYIIYGDIHVYDLLLFPFIIIFFQILKKIYVKISKKYTFLNAIKKDVFFFLNSLNFLINFQYAISFTKFEYKDLIVTYGINGFHYYLILYLGIKILKKLEKIFKRKAKKTESKFDDQIIPFIFSISKVSFFILLLSLFLSNAGFNLTSLIAGLSIGGAAIGFASKDLVSNIFGSLTVFIDKPFQLGDRIKISGIEGNIEEIGIRVTKIRTFSDTIEYVPNSKFTSELIENVSLMNSRRIKEYLFLEYPENVEDFRKWKIEMNSYIKNDKIFNMHKSNFLHIDKMDTKGLNIQIYIFTNTTNWGEWKDEKEKLFLKTIEFANKYGLSFSREYRKES